MTNREKFTEIFGCEIAQHDNGEAIPGHCKILIASDMHFNEWLKQEYVPSAQPGWKGKWVGVGYDGDWLKTMCKCSKCGAMIDINEKYRNFFCYHCGADMRGEQDG